jgi:hypothetical protein
MKPNMIIPILLFGVSIISIILILTGKSLYNYNGNISHKNGMLYRENYVNLVVSFSGHESRATSIRIENQSNRSHIKRKARAIANVSRLFVV